MPFILTLELQQNYYSSGIYARSEAPCHCSFQKGAIRGKMNNALRDYRGQRPGLLGLAPRPGRRRYRHPAHDPPLAAAGTINYEGRAGGSLCKGFPRPLLKLLSQPSVGADPCVRPQLRAYTRVRPYKKAIWGWGRGFQGEGGRGPYGKAPGPLPLKNSSIYPKKIRRASCFSRRSSSSAWRSCF